MIAGGIRYIVDEDAILTYVGDFTHEIDIPASARALVPMIEATLHENFPDFRVEVTTQRGPVAREVGAWAEDEDWSTDDIERAVCAYVEDVWFHNADEWLVNR